MKNDYLNIYNNLIKLTRNKNLYLNLKNNDTFSDRLVVLLFHYSFFLKFYKSQISTKESQDLFDFIIEQLSVQADTTSLLLFLYVRLINLNNESGLIDLSIFNCELKILCLQCSELI